MFGIAKAALLGRRYCSVRDRERERQAADHDALLSLGARPSAGAA